MPAQPAAAVTITPVPPSAQAQVLIQSPSPEGIAEPGIATDKLPQTVPMIAAPALSSAATQATRKKEGLADEAVLSEAEGRKLAQKNSCFACHAIEKKVVGPAWKEVAAKYRGQQDAENRLIAKVTKGGSGVWGTVPMPPNGHRVSAVDIRNLVRFILSLE